MQVIIGTRGWTHKEWMGDYYPNSLPEDWYLSHYSKNFYTVLVPESLWRELTLEEITECCSDVPKEYPILFEKISEQPIPEEIEQIVPNWITFETDNWQCNETEYQIRQATVLTENTLQVKAGVFEIKSNEILSDAELTSALKQIKNEHKTTLEHVYLIFAGAATSLDNINTAKTITRMLDIAPHKALSFR